MFQAPVRDVDDNVAAARLANQLDRAGGGNEQGARALVAMGVTKGDRISIYLRAEEALRFMVAYSAVHKAGAVAVPTNTRLTDSELRDIVTYLAGNPNERVFQRKRSPKTAAR